MHNARRDKAILARIFGAVGLELKRDGHNVARIVRRENRRGEGLQRACELQRRAGRTIIR